MKPIATLFLFFATLFFTSAQAQPELLAGGWSTSNSNRYTRITATANLDSKIYRIDCTIMADTTILQFNLIVDGAIIPASFFEGSYVVVEGKNIAIQQVNPGQMVKGTWKVIQEPEIAPVPVQWQGYPKLNKDILIASLKTEQEFVLGIPSALGTPCSNTAMTVYIDGQAVRDNNNNILSFWGGSSIYGKGKSIVIKLAGSCTGNNPVTGELKLRK